MSNLPVNGSTVYVRLYSYLPTGWQYNDYTFIAYHGGGAPVWSVSKTHTGNFSQGQTGNYTITATNSGTAATSAPATVTESLPGGLTVSSMSGTGWNCAPPTVAVRIRCRREAVIQPLL